MRTIIAFIALALTSAACKPVQSVACDRYKECGMVGSSIEACEANVEAIIDRSPSACEQQILDCTALQTCSAFAACQIPSCKL